MVGLSSSKATAQSSGCGCWKFTQPGWGGDFCFVFFCLFAKKPAVSKSRVTLLTCVALATLRAVIQVHPVFSRGLWGGWSRNYC